MICFFTLILSLFTTMVLIPPLTRLALRSQLVDIPTARKVHTSPTPKVGGLAIAAGALLPIILWVDFTEELKGWIVGLTIITVLGLLDDFYELRYKEKFVGQFIAASIAVFLGKISLAELGNFWGIEIILPFWAAIPLTIIFIVGVTNAINLADGLDGLAAGITFLVFGGIGYLAYRSGEPTIVICSLAIMGGLFGFLRFNTYPATVFMGDTGSQFLGFSAGLLSLILTQKETNPLSPLVPIIILGFPILDTLTVITERIIQGRHPFMPDQNHFHHKLLKLGLSYKETVITIYLLQGLLVAFTLIFCYYPEQFLIGGYVLFSLIVIPYCYLLERYHWLSKRLRVRKPELGFALRDAGRDRIREWISWLILGILTILLIVSLLPPHEIPKDISFISLVLLILTLIIFLSRKKGWLRFFIRLDLYLMGTFLVYFAQQDKGNLININIYDLQMAIFILLAGLIAAYIKLSNPADFQTTTLDYLIIIIALIIPNLSPQYLPLPHLGMIAAQLIILFMGLEIVLTHMVKGVGPINIFALALLFATGIKGFI